MYYPLAKTLQDRKLFTEGMELTAEYSATAIGNVKDITVQGIFVVLSISENDNEVLFDVASTRDGHTRRIGSNAILEIDGMDPERFAEVYDIKADGSTKAPAKRRGRKPKNRNPDGSHKTPEQLAREAAAQQANVA